MDNKLIKKELILLDLEASSREDVIHIISSQMFLLRRTTEPALLHADIMRREEVVSTFAGSFTAIPHTITKYITEPTLCFARISNDDFTWSGIGEDVRFVFFLAVPEEGDLKTLRESQSHIFTAVAQLIGRMDILDFWKTTQDKQAILDGLNQAFAASH